MSVPEIDFDLVTRYNIPGPRYTSYPTAPQFREDFPRESLDTLLEEEARQAREPVSVYVHLPFCETLCWFCGCTTVISKDHSRADTYLDYLTKELDWHKRYLGKDPVPACQVHLGGGTPNYLGEAQILRLGDALLQRFQMLPDSECGVEMDPRRLTHEQVRAFRRIGMNRASFGVQDLQHSTQAAVNRILPEDTCLRTVEWIRDCGYTSLNIDLIYGLPFQTPDSFAHTLERVLLWNPERFSIFNYAHVPWMKPAQKLLKAETLPSPETKLRILHETIRTLTQSGYRYIGMDHFAREDDDLALAAEAGTMQRNFQGYSTMAGANIFAFGMSSISQSPSHYRQNARQLGEYYRLLDDDLPPWTRACFLNQDDQIRRDVISRIMCRGRLIYGEIEAMYGISFREYFSTAVQQLPVLASDGLIELEQDGFSVTFLGRLLLRNLAMPFDAYLASSEGRFSRTV